MVFQAALNILTISERPKRKSCAARRQPPLSFQFLLQLAKVCTDLYLDNTSPCRLALATILCCLARTSIFKRCLSPPSLLLYMIQP